MKLLWISHFLPYPPRAGLLQRSYYLIKNLSDSIDIDLVALNQPRLLHPLSGSARQPEEVAIAELGKFCRVLGYVDVEIRSVVDQRCLALRSLVTPYPYSISWLGSERFEAELLKAVSSTEYDVIHFDTIGLVQYLPRIVDHIGGAKITVGHHNAESHMLLRRAEQERNFLKKFYFLQEGYRLAKFEKEWCPRFDMNVVCSALDGERLATLTGAEPMLTVENGVELGSWPRREGLGDPYSLLFVGTMDWYPNSDAIRFFLKEVWPSLSERDERYRLDVVGANPPEDIRDIASRDGRVCIHGYVEDLAALLNRSGIFICPIRDGGGTKLKVLDAFAAGFAMVAHPLACEGIDVEDGRHVLLASTADEWLAQIERLACEQGLASSLGHEAARLVIEKYTFASIAGKFFDALKRLVEVEACVA